MVAKALLRIGLTGLFMIAAMYSRGDTKCCLLRRLSGKDERDLASEKEVSGLEGY